MHTYDETLQANVSRTLPVNGTYFILLESAVPLTINFEATAGRGVERAKGIEPGYWYEAPGGMSRIEVTSTVDQTIRYACSFGRGGYDTRSVQIKQGTVITDADPVTVAATVTPIMVADGTRKGAVFLADDTNVGRIAIGGAGVTFANAAIILAPGEDYADDNAAAAAWYAIAETAGDLLRVQERT